MRSNVPPPAQKKPWYLLTGLVFGVIIGLIISWRVFPVEYVDTPPSSLRSDLKDEYRVMIALSYAINRDLERAKVRLQLLDGEGYDDLNEAIIPTSAYQLAVQAQKALAEGQVETEAQALGLLAAALGQKPSPFPSPSSTPSPTRTSYPTATKTPIESMAQAADPSLHAEITATATTTFNPTRTESVKNDQTSLSFLPSQTPTPTSPPLFTLQSRKLICDPSLKQPMLQIQVINAQGTPLAGVKAIIQWEGGQDSFITGLKPERDAGYADYVLKPNTRYSLLVGESGLRVGDIQIEDCETSRQEKYGGTWLLTFRQVP